MRPPLNAGENDLGVHVSRHGHPRFNEAPAERGGERGPGGGRRHDRGRASMRPPLNAGEN